MVRPFSFQVDALEREEAEGLRTQQQQVAAHAETRQRPESVQYTPIDDNTQDSVQLSGLVQQSQAVYGQQQQQQQYVQQSQQQQQQYTQQQNVQQPQTEKRPPEQAHPAIFAPYAAPTPVATDKPLPFTPPTPVHHDDHKLHTPTTPARTAFVPDAFHGPNGIDLATAHQPGQIAHPNMKYAPPSSSQHAQPNERAWSSSLFACADPSTSCLSLFCPCIVYGRTTYRLAQRARRADATDLLGYSACNGHCVLFSLACGLHGILTGILSARVRHAYEIEGGVCADFCAGCCCACCALARDENEVVEREKRRRMQAGPAAGGYTPVVGSEQYSGVAGMKYTPHAASQSRFD